MHAERITGCSAVPEADAAAAAGSTDGGTSPEATVCLDFGGGASAGVADATEVIDGGGDSVDTGSGGGGGSETGAAAVAPDGGETGTVGTGRAEPPSGGVTTGGHTIVTRSGRCVRPPERYGFP